MSSLYEPRYKISEQSKTRVAAFRMADADSREYMLNQVIKERNDALHTFDIHLARELVFLHDAMVAAAARKNGRGNK